jgi:hypothetical protein
MMINSPIEYIGMIRIPINSLYKKSVKLIFTPRYPPPAPQDQYYLQQAVCFR